MGGGGGGAKHYTVNGEVKNITVIL